MRIRKRFLLSSLSSLPLSDPQLNRSPPRLVQQQLQDSNSNTPSDSPNQRPSPPSDQNLMMLRSQNPRWVFSGRPKDMEGEEAMEEKSNDTEKGNILASGLLQETGSSHQEGGRWGEEDKVVPPKKRRRSFDHRRGVDHDNKMGEKEKKTKAKMKSKTNKKCVELVSNGDDDDEEEEGHDGMMMMKKMKKKVKRGSVIMEGSRCSRVNGRGWRCCQQTLVGYSLCEHHLGKGRLRSIATVRINGAVANNTTSSAPKEEKSQQLSTFAVRQEKVIGQRIVEDEEDDEDEDEDEDDEEEEEKPLMMRKKKTMKIGMVKARSISSLLGQTN